MPPHPDLLQSCIISRTRLIYLYRYRELPPISSFNFEFPISNFQQLYSLQFADRNHKRCPAPAPGKLRVPVVGVVGNTSTANSHDAKQF
ncbi:Protein of unknown function [Pyronema omphalodes CBS 100304]|uniref:Uncharacterized protein n=1 Tax=Pyronema omphalodes (strain CBS 100304) TaxID=1076935 RepID=U4KWI5_PYROM|nr:Protein of unknown function [Pyronema omphalodes CBS 100304]